MKEKLANFCCSKNETFRLHFTTSCSTESYILDPSFKAYRNDSGDAETVNQLFVSTICVLTQYV